MQKKKNQKVIEASYILAQEITYKKIEKHAQLCCVKVVKIVFVIWLEFGVHRIMLECGLL